MDVRKFFKDLEEARKKLASQKLPRISGTVTSAGPEWFTIETDDGGEYIANITGEKCGPLQKGQKVSFEPIRDCGFLQNVAAEVRVEG